MLSFPLEPARGARLLLQAYRNLGDVPGHEFHGNQWTEGTGNLSPDDKKLVAQDWAWPNTYPGGPSYEHLRNPKTPDGKRMTAVLEKLPVHEGVTYRGIALSNDKDVAKLVAAKGYKLNLHSSTSKEFNTAISFADAESYDDRKAFVLEMHGRSRDINAHLPEDLQGTKETVAIAGTRYKFVSLSHEHDKTLKRDFTRIVLKEQR